MSDFSSSSSGLAFFWFGIAGKTQLGFRCSLGRPGKRGERLWLWERPVFGDLEIGAGGRITGLVRRDLNFLASWDGNWTRGNRKKEKVHRKWKAWHFYKWFCSFFLNCCLLLCVLKPVLEKWDQNINKKLYNPGKAYLHLKKTTPVLSDLVLV